MVERSMPALRNQNESVPSTSSKGKPAEKPKASMRKLAGSAYTRSVCAQVRRGVGDGVELAGAADTAEVEGSDMGDVHWAENHYPAMLVRHGPRYHGVTPVRCHDRFLASLCCRC